eukprot:217282-Chlamydomonas_euryale.AAC.6
MCLTKGHASPHSHISNPFPQRMGRGPLAPRGRPAGSCWAAGSCLAGRPPVREASHSTAARGAPAACRLPG